MSDTTTALDERIAAMIPELRSLAFDIAKMGDFINRPDLNVDNIKQLDWIAGKLHELISALE